MDFQASITLDLWQTKGFTASSYLELEYCQGQQASYQKGTNIALILSSKFWVPRQ